jgi:hypothetical protein
MMTTSVPYMSCELKQNKIKQVINFFPFPPFHPQKIEQGRDKGRNGAQ